jgi:hypothetical protein
MENSMSYVSLMWIKFCQNHFDLYVICLRSLDSSVSISTGYGLDDRGVGVRVPKVSIIFSTSSRLALRSIQPPIQWDRDNFTFT